MFPRVFARLNANGVPGAGLVIVARADDDRAVRDHVADAGRSVQSHRRSRRHPDHRAVRLLGGRGREGGPRPQAAAPRRSALYKWIALAAVAYCLWAVIGGDPDTVVHAMVALLISVPLYPFFIRSMEAAAKRNAAAQTRRSIAATPRDRRACRRWYMQGVRHASRHARALADRCRVHRVCAAGVAAEEEEKPVAPPGLPAGFDWSFNFDATWGAFGFAQLALHESEARPAVRRSQRQLDRGLDQARAQRAVRGGATTRSSTRR